ncbi:MAG: hypothetical protein CM1200mP10_21000 [Candidatus Neomarinimicrobiota bacterium]|nr:MAG: hypothetical protein CM1200mP10_21000 [Candidatus Neomarinimicrobiota bacterium]
MNFMHMYQACFGYLDEAYFEFAAHIEEYPDSMKYRYDNVITLRTFSKAYGLAGLRIGYGFSHETLINNLLKGLKGFPLNHHILPRLQAGCIR